MSSWYERHILPKLIDAACSQPPMTDLRARYVPQAYGDVLEIGIGSGLNLAHYSDSVRSVTGVDPAAELTVTAQARAAKLDLPVEVVGISGEALDLDSHSFDSVVCTWTLCSIANPYRAVDELRRVLKPQGSLIFIEHGQADTPGVQRWQRRIEPLWKRIGGGCHLTRRVDSLLSDGGFALQHLEQGYVPGPKIAAYMRHGLATPR